jgi:hypothetical protein
MSTKATSLLCNFKRANMRKNEVSSQELSTVLLKAANFSEFGVPTHNVT